jgi:PPOX class probable F420-dependent enzyme
VSAPTDLSALGDEAFVSLTTYRRNGDAVSTPVWVARDGDALVVTTAASTGKVTRLRRDPRIVLRPCDRRGKVAPDAPSAEGRAEVVEDPQAQEAPERALATKYGWEYRLISVIGLAARALGRTRERVILRLRD